MPESEGGIRFADSIGALAYDFSDPTGLLSDCHRRIEMFLGSLAIATQVECPLDGETTRALESALRYFREAAPKHIADEEESLFPRLRRMDYPELQSALESLDILKNDHRLAISLHDRVDGLGRKCLLDGVLPPAEAKEFSEAISSLKTMYVEHIRIEDTAVFPAAARSLTPSERAAIADEMAARRQIKLVTEIPPARA
jgi:hypothetical protein